MTFSNPVVGGENGELIRRSIQSPDYVAGVSGWTINRDGSAEFNNVTIRLDLTTGSIVVGPDTGPQVVIRISGGTGLIQFPTNSGDEATPASIQSDALTDESVLTIESAFMGGSATSSKLDLYSGDDTVAIEPFVVLGAYGTAGNSILNLTGPYAYMDAPTFFVGNEIVASDDNPDANTPIRVVSGRVNTGTNTVTLVAGDTEITNTAATSTYLVNGVAYTVDIQVQTRQSVGTSAAGTQRFDWKLWDGAVGGTQLGPTTETWNTSVGNNLSTIQVSFIFEYTGITGSKTLRLSCADGGGADTLQVQSNSRFFHIVKRIGDPAKILGL